MSMVETLLLSQAEWLSGVGPQADIVARCECGIVRNLSDFPFPGQCTEEEKRAVQDRLVAVFQSLDLFATGQFWNLHELDEREGRFLEERGLVTKALLQGEGPRGVYIGEDQAISILVNEENHVKITGLGSGLQMQQVWSRISLLDDMLTGVLDFAFHERLGYLTAAVANLGTGLEVRLLLHLPGLTMSNGISSVQETAAEKRHSLDSWFVSQPGAPGDLYTLTNVSSLGRSEDEIILHLKHLTGEIIAREREARSHLRSQAPLKLDDRVGRALGLARGARLLAFEEALSVLSSLRLGVSSGLLDQYTLQDVNEVFLASQNAHIEMKYGQDCDELTLSAGRADVFRSRFV